MDRHEIALNYDRYGRPIGQHRERGLTLQKKLSVNAEESLDEILEPLVDYMESDEPAPNPNNPMYWAWKQTVEAGGPHSHIFTLAFKRPYSDQQAIAALSDWATMMNRRIKGPRWKKKAHGLAGVAFAEEGVQIFV